MKKSIWFLLASGFLTTATSLLAQGTAFTYQGRLLSNGSPANGSYELAFTLYATNANGVPVAGPVTNAAVAVTNGLFTALVDFGSGVFTGTSNWLELAVGTNGANSFNPLAPRQQLTPTPYALYATKAASAATATTATTATNLTGTLPQAQLPASVVTNGASGVTLTGTFSGTGTGLTVTTPTSANFAFAYDTTTQYFNGLNSFANITFNSNGLLSGWAHSAGTGTFTCEQTGIYLVEYHVQPAVGANSVNGDVMTVRAALNGSEISGSAAAHTVYYVPDTQPEITKTFIASIPSGSTLSFQVSDSTTSNSGSIAPAGTAATKPSASCSIIRIQ